MHDIFVSYSSKDQALADKLVRALEHRCLSCWISSRDIKPGMDFQAAIVAGLEASRAVLLLLSRNANLSKELPKELSLASSQGRPIIPVRLEDVAPAGALAYQLSHAQFVDLFHDYDRKLAELSRYLTDLLEKPMVASAAFTAQRGFARAGVLTGFQRWGIAAGVLASIFVVSLFIPYGRLGTVGRPVGPLEAALSDGGKATPQGVMDVIAASNTEFRNALRLQSGVAYLSRFYNDDTSRFFSFRQPATLHDLLVIFVKAPDDFIKPALTIYKTDGTMSVHRLPESQDGARLEWHTPIMPDDYILEVKPNGRTGDFDRFLIIIKPE